MLNCASAVRKSDKGYKSYVYFPQFVCWRRRSRGEDRERWNKFINWAVRPSPSSWSINEYLGRLWYPGSHPGPLSWGSWFICRTESRITGWDERQHCTLPFKLTSPLFPRECKGWRRGLAIVSRNKWVFSFILHREGKRSPDGEWHK